MRLLYKAGSSRRSGWLRHRAPRLLLLTTICEVDQRVSVIVTDNVYPAPPPAVGAGAAGRSLDSVPPPEYSSGIIFAVTSDVGFRFGAVAPTRVHLPMSDNGSKPYERVVLNNPRGWSPVCPQTTDSPDDGGGVPPGQPSSTHFDAPFRFPSTTRSRTRPAPALRDGGTSAGPRPSSRSSTGLVASEPLLTFGPRFSRRQRILNACCPRCCASTAGDDPQAHFSRKKEE